MSSTVATSGPRKAKGIHVTREQKSVLKDAFKFIPYPDHYPDSLNKLSADTGLDQEAIKKWFRNRRKKMSTKMGDNDDQEEILDMQGDDASKNDESMDDTNELSKNLDESVDDSNVDVLQHGALVDSNDVANEELAAEKVQDANNVPTEEVVSGNVEVSNVNNEVVESRSETKDQEFSDGLSEPTANSGNMTVVLNDTVEESKVDENADVASFDESEPKSNVGVEKDTENPVIGVTSDQQINPNSTIEIVDNDEKTKPNDGTEEMSTEEKAGQYDVLKNEFSALQSKFESLAKVLGSHGIDVGDESEAPAQPSAVGPVQQNVDYPQEQSAKAGESVVPKQEPQPYGWPNQDYNNQMYNQPWMPYQQYPPVYPNGYAAPYPPQNYNLPYPPPEYPFYNQPPMQQVQDPSLLQNVQNAFPSHQVQDAAAYPPLQEPEQNTIKTPKSRTKAPKKKATPTNQSRATPYTREALPAFQNQVDETGAAPTYSFQGVICAAKKSFQGPSKLKSKSQPKIPKTQTLYPPSTMPANQSLHPLSGNNSNRKPPGPSKPKSRSQPKVPAVQTLYPPSVMPPLQSLPLQNPRRKTLPPKKKLGAHPKPLPKTAPVNQYEQSLQASNPFRQTTPKAPASRRKSLPGKVQRQPEIQTLYPPIQNSQPKFPRQQKRPDVEFLRGVNKKTIQKPQEVPRTLQGIGGVSVRKVPGPSFPMMSSSISIQKVYNPLTDPNKPQELKKVLSMSNLSVSLSRK